MATNLVATPGQLQACILRVSRLDASCVPQSGSNNQVVTAGLASVQATPDTEESTKFEQKNGCGAIAWQAEEGCDKIKRYTLTVELATFDYELLEIMTGGSLILANNSSAPSTWRNKVIGFASPGNDTSCPNGVSLEIFTKAAYNSGTCTSLAGGTPQYVRHIFPRAFFIPSDRNFENDIAVARLTGYSTPNPAWQTGATTDWIGAAALPEDTPYAQLFASALPTVSNAGAYGAQGGGYAA